MRILAQQQNQSQKPVIGNQAVQRIPKSHAEELKDGLTGTASPRFGHDFSRIPIHPPAARSIQTKPAVIQSGDDYERSTAVPPIIATVVHSPGVPLDPAVRASAEARLGFDFSHVRVHADEAAARSADAALARAYTVGSHIAFARGEYRPRTPEGARLVLHELVHVAQQGRAADAAPTPQSMTQPHEASEREAHALAGHSGAGASQPPRIASRLGPVVARFDVEGARLQEERSEALRRGLNPDEPVSEPPDILEQELEEATRNPPPRVPEPTIPGDHIQQARAVPRVDAADLWPLPRIQDPIKTIAAETEARERETMKPGGEVKHTAANMMDYWRPRFVHSVEYILYIRDGGRRDKLLRQLRAEEEKLVKSVPVVPPSSSRSPESAEQVFREKFRISELRAQVEALRRTFTDRWQQEVDRVADQFVTLASNESRFLTVGQAAAPVSIYGLPEYIEGTVEASAHPATIAKGSTPVAPSVVEFMKAVQKESSLKEQASNYAEHEKHSPYLGNIEGVGKYSFDVHLDGLIGVNAEGFYEREPLVKFFLAVDRAATATRIAWIALYNDFEVAKTVNEKLGKRRIGFSGGGSAGPGREGSIHHGPSPYILHIHFNIMPIDLAAQYIAGKPTPPRIDLGGP